MTKLKEAVSKKFGTFQGVFIPSTEAILGTVLFLILPALVVDVGFLPIALIIILAHTVTTATAFSLSDIATNLNTIGGGGMYALSRRSLGKAFGGSIGIMLYFAQAASIAFYCIGFASPLRPFLGAVFNNFNIFSTQNVEILLHQFINLKEQLEISGLNSINGYSLTQLNAIISGYQDQLNILFLRQSQIIASIIFLVFFIIAMVGADFTLKIQFFILIILFGSVLAIFLSPLLGIKVNLGKEEFDGVNLFVSSFKEINLFGSRKWGNFPVIAIFFLTFTQFFPAVTGIDAGVGMSGDLKNPKRSLVRGTFFAISVTFVVYMIAALIFSLMDKNIVLKGMNYDLNSLGIPEALPLTNLLGLKDDFFSNITYFPSNIPGIMIFLGILFATSSSALSCFMTAPRTAQSLSRDKVLPGFLGLLGKDFKKGGDEPRFATLLTFFIAFIVILIGNINIAAMIVGICFLVVYGWMNGSAFFERISRNPTFRPTIKNHWSVSLYGLLASLVAICLFNWWIGVLIIVSQLVIFWLILRFRTENRLEGVWWGVMFTFVTNSLKSLKKIVQGTKNWRPIVSVISYPENFDVVMNLAHLGERIAAIQGLVYLNILQSPKNKMDIENNLQFSIPTRVIQLTGNDITQGILSLIQSCHPGDITPNSILMEYRKNISSLDVISRSISLGKNFFLLKNGERLSDFSKIDIWWRGQKNGNIMVLLAYIIKHYNSPDSKKTNCNIRIIRKLGKNESKTDAYNELHLLLEKGRLSGEVMILPSDDKSISETINMYSKESDLIMVGMPGKINSEGISKVFRLNERFFDKEIHKYEQMPPMLFVKSAQLMNLIEDSNM